MEELELKLELPIMNEGAPDKELNIIDDGDQSINNDGRSTDDMVKDYLNRGENPVKQDGQVSVSGGENDYARELVKKYFGASTIDVENDEGEFEERSIDEMDFTLDEVIEMIKDNHKDKVKDIKSKSIEIDGLDEIRKGMIKAIQAGKNPKEVLFFQESYVDPMSNIDLSTEDGQIAMVRIGYQEAIDKGTVTEDDFERIVRGLKEDDALESKSLEISDKIKDALKAKAKEMEQSAIEQKEKTKQFYKEYRKDFKVAAETNLELSPTVSKELVDFILEPDQNEKGMTRIEAKLLGMLRNPEEAAEVSLFIYDRELYNKRARAKINNQLMEEEKKRVRIKRKERENRGAGFTEEETKESGTLFTLE